MKRLVKIVMAALGKCSKCNSNDLDLNYGGPGVYKCNSCGYVGSVEEWR